MYTNTHNTMAAKIYSGIKGIECPKVSFEDYRNGTWRQKEEDYISKLKETCKKNSEGNAVGEIIKFNVADGHAMYMVYSLKPLQLIHLNLGDGWQSEFAELLTVKKVLELVAREHALKEILAKHKNK